ncbi:hypothetical protein OROGR_028975 [Orobanche gracilis]
MQTLLFPCRLKKTPYQSAMGDAENNQTSKKRAGVELNRDNPGLDDDDEETSEQPAGTFRRATDEVLASRRIVKVRRHQTPSPAPSIEAPSPASNPFAGIRLVPPASSSDNIKSENKVDEPKSESDIEEKTDGADDNAKKSESKVDDDPKSELNAQKDETDGKERNDNGETNASKDVKYGENGSGEENAQNNSEASSFSSFQQLSNGQNAFSGITGSGFSSTSFSFGSLSKDGSANSIFGGFGSPSNNNSSIFGTSVANTDASKSEGSRFPPMQEVIVETGEENEKAVFSADSVLFEFIDGGWKERGKGELKVNVSTTGTGKARLVMRARGNYRLILNANLFPGMKLTNMEKKGITFACVNSADEGKVGLSTIALKFKDASFVGDFQAAVMEHKGKNDGAAFKTGENSPKVSDE